MKKILLPSVIVIIVTAIALSMGAFTGNNNPILVSDDTNKCGRAAVMISANECGDKITGVSVDNRECSDKIISIKVTEAKECGSAATNFKAVEKLECPYSGAVMRAADEKESCGDKATPMHASVGNTEKDEVCCEQHALASVN